MTRLLRNRWVQVGAGLVAGAAAVLGAVWTAAGDRAGVIGAVEAQEATIEDHESRLRSIEQDLPAIRTDVSWIRQAMERERK